MRILYIVLITIMVIFIALYMGKTTITPDSFQIERPYTAILFIVWWLASLLES